MKAAIMTPITEKAKIWGRVIQASIGVWRQMTRMARWWQDAKWPLGFRLWPHRVGHFSTEPPHPPALPADLIRGPFSTCIKAAMALKPAHGSRPRAAPVVWEAWTQG